MFFTSRLTFPYHCANRDTQQAAADRKPVPSSHHPRSLPPPPSWSMFGSISRLFQCGAVEGEKCRYFPLFFLTLGAVSFRARFSSRVYKNVKRVKIFSRSRSCFFTFIPWSIHHFGLELAKMFAFVNCSAENNFPLYLGARFNGSKSNRYPLYLSADNQRSLL